MRQLAQNDRRRIDALRLEICAINHRFLPELNGCPEIIVSLTSYGKRVGENAPFAIMSILKQTVLPHRIVLNLDKNAWNDDNIPALLKTLQLAGLEICYCEDIGPHTKLLPTLKAFPEAAIITVDDDIIYEDNLIDDLLSTYRASDKKTIICREAVQIKKDEDGNFVPYSQSPEAQPGMTSVGYIPYGFRGVLYPPHIFQSNSIFDLIFRDICRNADDIWFGLTEYKEHISIHCAQSKHMELVFVNTVEQYNPTSATCLYYDNSILGKNDIQFNNVIEHYKL